MILHKGEGLVMAQGSSEGRRNRHQSGSKSGFKGQMIVTAWSRCWSVLLLSCRGLLPVLSRATCYGHKDTTFFSICPLLATPVGGYYLLFWEAVIELRIPPLFASSLTAPLYRCPSSYLVPGKGLAASRRNNLEIDGCWRIE